MRLDDFDAHRRAVLVCIGIGASQRIFSLNGYPAVCIDGKSKYVHRLVYEHVHGGPLRRADFVHHLDEDRTNFLPQNLQRCTHGNHNQLHRKFGQDNHFFGKTHSPGARARIALARLAQPRRVVGEATRSKLATQARARSRRFDGTQRFAPKEACA